MSDVKSVSTTPVSSTTVTASTSSNVTSSASSNQLSIVQDLLNLWPVKILTSLLPGGGIITNILTQVTNYIESVEKAVAIKGSGVAKKSIVVEATVKYILQDFPELSPMDWILSWAVGEIVDFIVHMKNKFGWNWIPLQ